MVCLKMVTEILHGSCVHNTTRKNVPYALKSIYVHKYNITIPIHKIMEVNFCKWHLRYHVHFLCPSVQKNDAHFSWRNATYYDRNGTWTSSNGVENASVQTRENNKTFHLPPRQTNQYCHKITIYV